jgi:hypothetical protein
MWRCELIEIDMDYRRKTQNIFIQYTYCRKNIDQQYTHIVVKYRYTIQVHCRKK